MPGAEYSKRGAPLMIDCRRMTAASRANAFVLLRIFLEDAHYLDNSRAYGAGGEADLEEALDLFLTRPELGFVWLAYDNGEPVAVCVVCVAISTSVGAVVAKLDDVFVATGKQGRGIGAAHLTSLKGRVAADGRQARGIRRGVNGHEQRYVPDGYSTPPDCRW
jgi:GNAT superfamily N-acetyltransferase